MGGRASGSAGQARLRAGRIGLEETAQGARGGDPGESRARRPGIWLCAVLVLSFAAPARGDEYALKAAFLYQFSKYVTWPEPPADTFDICVLGQDPFGRRLDETLEKRTANGRPLAARRIHAPPKSGACRIVFVSRSEGPQLARVIAALEGQPTLTVSDLSGFPGRGGMIHLKLVEDRIKLEINPDAAERVGLKIRSELLRLAEVVRP